MKLLKHYDFTTMDVLHPDFTVAVGDKWHNDELQQYHNRKENIFFNNGLVLQATLEDGVIKSARIHTRNNFSFTYGRIDIIAKLPNGKGTWPALWMMPLKSEFGHWPKSGEIDIMEYSGNHPDELVYALHTETHNHKLKSEYVKRITRKNINETFHTFSLLWEEEKITYYLDDEIVTVYHKGQEGKDPSYKGWPFTKEFYFIMNLAIGGFMGGKVDYSCFPQQFIIKDIKVYQK